MQLILASQSPRRQELLKIITPDFKVIQSNQEEICDINLKPFELVMHLALIKAKCVALKNYNSLVIGADTVVCIDGEILGKPHDKKDCIRMLRKLSGRVHQVYTGVALVKNILEENLENNILEEIFYVKTEVEFLKLSEEDINWYSSLDEPYDKAGGYGIQGKGSLLVKGICGDYYNVMGLPVSVLCKKLKDALKNSKNLVEIRRK